MIFGKSHAKIKAEHQAKIVKMYDGVVPHKVFAWYPVPLIDGQTAWLCYVWQFSTDLSVLEPSWRTHYSLTKTEADTCTRRFNQYFDRDIDNEVRMRLGP